MRLNMIVAVVEETRPWSEPCWSNLLLFVRLSTLLKLAWGPGWLVTSIPVYRHVFNVSHGQGSSFCCVLLRIISDIIWLVLAFIQHHMWCILVEMQQQDTSDYWNNWMSVFWKFTKISSHNYYCKYAATFPCYLEQEFLLKLWGKFRNSGQDVALTIWLT